MKHLLLFILIAVIAPAHGEVSKLKTNENNWKLKLQSGELSTPYSHYTVLAEGICGDLIEGFSCPKGNAIMGIKVWATDIDEPPYMVKNIGSQIGFEVTGEIQIYETEPEETPRENPHGYDIQFTPFE